MIKEITMVLLSILGVMLVIGLVVLASSVHSRTAFWLLAALVGIMSFAMAFNVVSFLGGIVFTVFVSLIVLLLDELRFLA